MPGTQAPRRMRGRQSARPETRQRSSLPQLGREIIACGKLTTSSPKTPASSATGNRSGAVLARCSAKRNGMTAIQLSTRPDSNSLKRDGRRAWDVLCRHGNAELRDGAQSLLPPPA